MYNVYFSIITMLTGVLTIFGGIVCLLVGRQYGFYILGLEYTFLCWAFGEDDDEEDES